MSKFIKKIIYNHFFLFGNYLLN